MFAAVCLSFITLPRLVCRAKGPTLFAAAPSRKWSERNKGKERWKAIKAMTVHSSYCVFYVAIFKNHPKWLGCKEKMKKGQQSETQFYMFTDNC